MVMAGICGGMTEGGLVFSAIIGVRPSAPGLVVAAGAEEREVPAGARRIARAAAMTMETSGFTGTGCW